ncbi:MAG TPA: tetratricopeptide repeat protein [Thermoanaerobaculia bacterium]|nr:tetratricopeptide repeat protein [Thermoanaerobaculia bacterium]
MHDPMDTSPLRPPSAGQPGTLSPSFQGQASPAWSEEPAGEHPTAAEVERLFRGELPAGEVRRILTHLLPGCPVCQERTADLWRQGLEPDAAVPTLGTGDSARYDGAVAQVFDRVRQARCRLEAERAEACAALTELESLPQERRRLLVQNRPAIQTWGLCEALLARAESGAAPGVALAWAELAVAAARLLDPRRYPAPSLQDLRARAWTALAEAHRGLGELAAADEAMRSAWSHLERGTGDRIERARLLDTESLLRRAQGRHRDAARQLDRAIRLYQRTGQRHLWSRALIRQGHARVQAGDLEGGVVLVQQALQAADPPPGVGRWRPLLQGLAGRLRRVRRAG